MTFVNGDIYAMTQLYAMPFVSAHLIHALDGMQSVVEELLPELRDTLGGQVFSPYPDGSADADEASS